jgi:hypothetical protein
MKHIIRLGIGIGLLMLCLLVVMGGTVPFFYFQPYSLIVVLCLVCLVTAYAIGYYISCEE